jgi:hypothetical protein
MSTPIPENSDSQPSFSWPRRLAITVCLIVGCVFSFRAMMPDVAAKVASEASQRAELQGSVDVKLVTKNIEDIQLGQRVVGRNPLRHETQSPSEIDPATWRAVRLHMIQNGVEYDLAFLRPLSWLKSTSAVVGGSIHMELHEMGLNGPARVVGIDPCPAIEPDNGTGRNVVTGTMAHPGANIVYLDITGLDEPLGVTDTHPIWSETRQDFVVAGQLKVGEQFRTVTGQPATLTKIHPHRGPPEMVFNLEVDGQHVYHVANSGLLVHNGCGIATITGSSSHVAVAVTEGTQTVSSHVHGIANATIENADDWIFGKTAKYLEDVTVRLPDATAAMKKQEELLGKGIDYTLGSNDCVSHVKDILGAGGLDVSSLPSSVHGFLDALRKLR